MTILDSFRSKSSKPSAPAPATVGTESKPESPVRQSNEAISRYPGLSKVKNIIAVAAGKGGVGKSTVATNLAVSLAAQGVKVGVLDADVYGPSMMKMLEVTDTPQTDGSLIKPAKAKDISVVSLAMFAQGQKAAIMRGPMAGNVIKQFLTQVDWGELDFLIVDYPPGTGDIQLTISQTVPVQGAVIVTTPQEVALLDVRKAVQMFKTLKVPVMGIVETMSYFEPEDGKRYHIFGKGGGEKLAVEFGLSLLGEIPIMPEIAEGGDTGRPIVAAKADSIASQQFQAAAEKLRKQVEIIKASDSERLNEFSITWK